MSDGGSEMGTPTPVEVNIDIEKTQGNAIYSSLLGLQNTLDNFQLDVKQDSLRDVVFAAIKDAVKDYMNEVDKKQQAEDEKRRAEGKPATAFEAYQMATRRNTDAINKFNHNSDVIKRQYKNISDLLCELLGRVNLFPYEKPKFKDDNGNVLLNSLYLLHLLWHHHFRDSLWDGEVVWWVIQSKISFGCLESSFFGCSKKEEMLHYKSWRMNYVSLQKHIFFHPFIINCHIVNIFNKMPFQYYVLAWIIPRFDDNVATL